MKSTLQFRADGRFTIVQFTDLHWHNGEAADQQTRELMERVLDDQRPDLVMLTGDVLAGGGCRSPRDSLDQVAEILESRGLPWGFVFGNHDDEGSASRKELMEHLRSYPHCLAEPGPEAIPGVGNYVLPVLSSTDGQPAALLYALDSGSYASTDIGGYAWIRREQIAWYVQQAQRYAQDTGDPLPALAFFHIPLPEYDEVWDHHTCYGYKYEAVCCPRVNTGLFAAMHEMGDVMGVFVGHDHINDYEGELHGIRLCYCRGSGYATYGKEGFPRGARIIRLTEGERRFETWQQLADGSLLTDPPAHPPAGRVLSEEN